MAGVLAGLVVSDVVKAVGGVGGVYGARGLVCVLTGARREKTVTGYTLTVDLFGEETSRFHLRLSET